MLLYQPLYCEATLSNDEKTLVSESLYSDGEVFKYIWILKKQPTPLVGNFISKNHCFLKNNSIKKRRHPYLYHLQFKLYSRINKSF